MKRTPFGRILLLFLSFLLLAIPSFVSLADGDGYEMAYTGAQEAGEILDNAYSTGLITLTDPNGDGFPAYCMDAAVYIVNGSVYARQSLSQAANLSEENAARIRAIILNSYPALTLSALQSAANLPTLTAPEAIAATQAAIWRLTDNLNLKLSKNNVKILYGYLLRLPGVSAPACPVGNIALTQEVTLENESCRAVYRYFTDGKNADGSDISLSHAFSKDLAQVYGASIADETSSDGSRTVTITNLPVDADYSFTVTGTQQLGLDAYYYAPQAGRTVTQSLVGPYSGGTLLSESVSFACRPPETYSLRVQKYDSTTQQGVEGAVFQLADNEAFSDPILYEKITDANGYVEFTGLKQGTWYLKEKTPPAGYIPDTKVYDIDIDQEPQDVIRFKNTHYGEIRILKVDDAGGPVEGAKFDIYPGDTAAGDPLFAGLISNSEGVILQGSIPPGTYTVVETEAPIGYHMSTDNSVTVTVEPHASATVSMTNPLIVRGKIGVAKADYTTGELLDGCQIGLYRDAGCEELLYSFVTDKDDNPYCENLLPGTYYVKELKAPEGYIINPARQVVEVKLTEGEIEVVTFRNRTRIDTAGNYGLLLLLGMGAVAVSGGLLILFRKKLVRQTGR